MFEILLHLCSTGGSLKINAVAFHLEPHWPGIFLQKCLTLSFWTACWQISFCIDGWFRWVLWIMKVAVNLEWSWGNDSILWSTFCSSYRALCGCETIETWHTLPLHVFVFYLCSTHTVSFGVGFIAAGGFKEILTPGEFLYFINLVLFEKITHWSLQCSCSIWSLLLQNFLNLPAR